MIRFPALFRLLAPLLLVLFGLVAAATAQTAAPAPAAQSAPAAATKPASDGKAAPPAAEKPVEKVTPPVEFEPEIKTMFERWRIGIAQAGAAVEREDANEQALRDVESTANAVRAEADGFLAQIAPRLTAVTQRIDQLTPADGSTPTGDADLLATARAEQMALLNTLQAADKQARVVRLRASELLTQVTDMRRNILVQHLSQQRESVFNLGIWQQFLVEAPRTVSALALLTRDWGGLIAARGTTITISLLILSLIGSLALFLPVRRFLVARATRDPGIAEVPPRRKAAAALAITVVFFALPVVSLLVVTQTLSLFNLVPNRIAQVLSTTVLATALYAMFHGLVTAIIAPGRPAWGYVPLAPGYREAAARRALIAAALVAISLVVRALARVIAVPAELIDVGGGVVAILVALITMSTLLSIARGLRVARESNPDAERAVSLWRWIMPLVWLIAFAAIAAAALGYVTLAHFLAGQIVWSALVLGLSFLLATVIDQTLQNTFTMASPVGRRLIGDLGITDTTVEQVGVVLSGIARLMLLIITFALLLAPLGVSSADWSRFVSITFTTITIGNVTISFGTILLAIVVFVAGVLATKGFQGWLDNQLLPKTRMDVGLKTSIRTGFGYLGIIGAGAAAFSIAGVSLANVALLAGALSVGIGFGLQSIVNNFVSGVILLAERPIKVGDWIVVGSDEGTVQRINVRSTELLTVDRQAIIIPNSNLISGVVRNWMHNDASGRLVLDIGASYDADPEKVRDILLECARAHPLILSFPEPKAFFTDFAESALTFRLVGYLSDIGTAYGVRSDLRYAVLKRFREEGVEIPFAQRDITLRNLDQVEHLIARLAGAAARPAASDDRSAG
ncbi:mechanosensitive ion channel domain-containing protein [Segnochrobactraceae bacterium EtOH-i3]